MAARFWVTGGTGNWNSTTNWSATTGGASGASVPSTADTAAFDASSGAGTATLDISPDIQTLTMTGFTGTLAFGTNTISLNSTGTIFTGATTMAVSGTPLIICTNSSATARTISPAAVTEANSISFRVTAGTGTLSLTTTHAVRNLDFTDGTNPTGYGGAFTGSTTNTVYGDFKASTNMSGVAGAGVLTFAATSGTKTIDTAGVIFSRPFTFNGIGGTFQLQAALTSGSTRACTLTNGTLDLNGYTATFGSVSSTNSNVRTFAFGSTGKFVLLSVTTVWTTSVATNLTVTGTDPLIQLTANAATGNRTITMGAAGEANAISVDVTAGSDTIGFGTTSGSYKNVNFTGFTGTYNASNSIFVFGNWNFGGTTLLAGTATITFSATSGTKTITSNGVSFPANVIFNGVGGTWEMQDALSVTNTLTMTNGTLKLKAGTTSTVGGFATFGTNAKYLLSTTFGSTATISDASGTNTVEYLTVQDSIATGGAIFNALAITNVDAGNNTGWLFSTTPSIGNEITMRLRSFTQPRRF
jgi:hypothetical protein